MCIVQFIHSASASLYLVDPLGSKEQDTVQAVNSWRYEKILLNCEKPALLLISDFLLVFRRFMIKRPSGEQLKKVRSKDVQHCLQRDGYNWGLRHKSQCTNHERNALQYCFVSFVQKSNRKALNRQYKY